MPALLRILFLVPLGFVAACLAAGLVLVAAAAGFGPEGIFTGRYLALRTVEVMVLAGIAGGMGFVPALVLIVVAEAFGIRSVLVHLLAGGLIGAVAGFAFDAYWATEGFADLKLFFAAGAVAGATYWAVAGRSAGSPLRNSDRALS